MNMNEIRASNSNLDEFFSEIEHDFSIYNNSKMDEFLNFSPDDYAPADNLNVLISGIQKYIKSIRDDISKFYGATKDSSRVYIDTEKNLSQKANNLPEDVSIGISNSSSSFDNYYDDYSDYDDHSDNMLNHDSKKNRDNDKINEIVVDDIILEKLAPFGINKSNIGEIISNDEYDYVITINGTDTNQNGLSKIYIKDGNIVGGADLNNNYVSIDNESLILDNDDSSTMDEVGIIGGGLVAGTVINKSDTSISLDNNDVNPNVTTNIGGNSVNTIDNINDKSKNNSSDVSNDNYVNYNDDNINNNIDNTYDETSIEDSSSVENDFENYMFNIDESFAYDDYNNLNEGVKADKDEFTEPNSSFE